MRQLIGKISIKGQRVVEEVYLSEQIRCRECQKTVPIGVEVVRVQKDGPSKKSSSAPFIADLTPAIMNRGRAAKAERECRRARIADNGPPAAIRISP